MTDLTKNDQAQAAASLSGARMTEKKGDGIFEKTDPAFLNRIEAELSDTGFRFDHPTEDWTEQDERLFEDLICDPYGFLYESSFENLKPEDPVLRYLFLLSDRFHAALLARPEIEQSREETKAVFSEDELDLLISMVPFALNAEKVDRSWLNRFFEHLSEAFRKDAAAWNQSMQAYFTSKNPDLHLPEKLCFQLVENPEDEAFPFAFMVTYTRKLPSGKVRHVPLSASLQEFRDEPQKMLSLLSSLNRASEISPLIEELTVSGELMHALRFTEQDAYDFLKATDQLMESGIICRVPNWWKKKQSSVSLNVSMGTKKQSLFGLETLISLKPSLNVNGRPLTKAEIRTLLQAEDGLVQIRGEWVEVNHEKLRELLEAMEQTTSEMTLSELLRQKAGIEEQSAAEQKAEIGNGAWLAGLFSKMKTPKQAAASSIPKSVHAKLRPYQKSGVNWLRTLGSYGFGACLADDMGLGKTLQILTYLEGIRQEKPDAKVLLVVPASLLGNWQAEAAKFTPEMPITILHGKNASDLEQILNDGLSFLNITTYGMAARIEGLQKITWDQLILDEAQAIKNPKTKQTRTIKMIPAAGRIAMTGTPVENDLSNLWSLFDFLNQGLLGSSRQFSDYAKKLSESPEGYGKLRNMIAPFLLRRLKTDKSIVPDLPDKIEQTDYIELSKRQKVLYRKFLDDLTQKLSDTSDEGIERKGIVLGALTSLKQICNHPDQYAGSGLFRPEDSGKYEFLREIMEPIAEKRECVLVFSQYRTMTEELDEYLFKLFGRKGLVINGSTPIKTRTEYARMFNEQKTWIPYMILSLKAASTGLNLTAASHVVHFDRWWNPAAENQATDRAFRIGQTKNVIVHKFVCKGTIEEKIDELMSEKQILADSLISAGEESAEKLLTSLSNDELLKMMRLEA